MKCAAGLQGLPVYGGKQVRVIDFTESSGGKSNGEVSDVAGSAERGQINCSNHCLRVWPQLYTSNASLILQIGTPLIFPVYCFFSVMVQNNYFNLTHMFFFSVLVKLWEKKQNLCCSCQSLFTL